jgi:hypothetical protein
VEAGAGNQSIAVLIIAFQNTWQLQLQLLGLKVIT